MTPQASASLALAEWQANRDLTPAQRIEKLVADCFLPPSVAPEVWLDCDECDGEGAIEKWESVSKWSIDPPCAHVLPCQACNGAGGMICEAEGDR